jgi:hypothetical protein
MATDDNTPTPTEPPKDASPKAASTPDASPKAGSTPDANPIAGSTPDASPKAASTPDASQPEAAASPQPSGVAANLGITEALKRGIADYLEKNDVHPKEGNELNVDLDFMKNHAGPLLAHLLRSATQSLMPKDLKFSVPTSPPPDKPDQAPVNVNFDLGEFISRLFNPPSTNPPR